MCVCAWWCVSALMGVVLMYGPRPDQPSSLKSPSVEATERRRLQEKAESLVRARLTEVFQMANASVDHIPPSTYHFEVRVCLKSVSFDEWTVCVYYRHL